MSLSTQTLARREARRAPRCPLALYWYRQFDPRTDPLSHPGNGWTHTVKPNRRRTVFKAMVRSVFTAHRGLRPALRGLASLQ